MLVAFLPTIFLALEIRVGAAVNFLLPAHVLKDPAPRPFNEPTVESVIGARAETGNARMGDPPSKPGIGEAKRSRAYKRAKRGFEFQISK
jgi:hypothetical protein